VEKEKMMGTEEQATKNVRDETKVSNKGDHKENGDTDMGGEDKSDGHGQQIDVVDGEGGGVHEPDSAPSETKAASGDDGGAGDAPKRPAKAPTDSDNEESAGGKIGLGFLVFAVGIIVYCKCCRKSGGGEPAMSGVRSSHTKYQEV
jgi:hypothetical protein